jgi:hypothetical protein
MARLSLEGPTAASRGADLDDDEVGAVSLRSALAMKLLSWARRRTASEFSLDVTTSPLLGYLKWRAPVVVDELRIGSVFEEELHNAEGATLGRGEALSR